MPKLSYKERERLRREQEILKTAARLMRERGISNLNMDDIAEEVGVSKPTLYQHFKSKEDMIAHTMLYSMKEMEEFMDSIKDLPAIEQFEQILRYMLRTHINPEDTPAMMSHAEFAGASHHPLVSQHLIRLGKYLRELVEQGKREGSIAPELPAVVVVSSMFSLLPVLQGPEIMHDYSITLDAVTEGIVRVFIRGIST